MDVINRLVLALTGYDSEIVAALVKKNSSDTHRLPQPNALLNLFVSEVLIVAERHISKDSNLWIATFHGSDDLHHFLVLRRIPLRNSRTLVVGKLQSVAENNHFVNAECGGSFLYVSLGAVHQAGVSVVNSETRRRRLSRISLRHR